MQPHHPSFGHYSRSSSTAGMFFQRNTPQLGWTKKPADDTNTLKRDSNPLPHFLQGDSTSIPIPQAEKKKMKVPERFMSASTKPKSTDTGPVRESVDIDEAFAHFQPLRNSFIQQFRSNLGLRPKPSRDRSDRPNRSDTKSDTSETRSVSSSEETSNDRKFELHQRKERTQQRSPYIAPTDEGVRRAQGEAAEMFGRNTHTLSRRIKDGIDQYLQGKFLNGTIVGRGVLRQNMLTDVRTALAFQSDFAPSAIAYMQMYMADWKRACQAIAGLSIPTLPFNTPFSVHQLRVTSCCRDGDYVLLIESEYPTTSPESHSIRSPPAKLNFRVLIKVLHDGDFSTEQVNSIQVKGYELKVCDATLSDVLLSVFTIQFLAFQLFPAYSTMQFAPAAFGQKM